MNTTLRLISGERILSPKTLKTRPTTLMVREAVFNILGKGVENSIWLDLFSGCGTIACEAYNHGAKKIIAVEKNRQNYKICLENLHSLQKNRTGENNIEVHCKDVLLWTKTMQSDLIRSNIVNLRNKLDYIYLDPPYKANYYDILLKQIFQSDLLNKETLVICEHSKFNEISSSYLWEIKNVRTYGQTKLTFLIKIKHP